MFEASSVAPAAGERTFQVAIVWEGGETAAGTRKAGEPSGEDEE